MLRCHNINLNFEGDGDCISESPDGSKWCFVFAEASNCQDIIESPLASHFKDVFHNMTLGYSEEACTSGQSTLKDLGNEIDSQGFEIEGHDLPAANGGGGFPVEDIQSCFEQCGKSANFQKFTHNDECTAWTFIEGTPNMCYLKGDGACCDQFKSRKPNPKAFSGYLCNCWSTEGECYSSYNQEAGKVMRCNYFVEKFKSVPDSAAVSNKLKGFKSVSSKIEGTGTTVFAAKHFP